MSADAQLSPSVVSETGLRRRIDRSVCRALVDGEYAQLLLADPTVILEEHDCAPQQYLSLLSIQATSVLDFARQAQALFWAVDTHSRDRVERVDTRHASPMPLATAI